MPEQGGILTQNRHLELLQRRTGIDAEFLVERRTDGTQRFQRIRLTSAPGECKRLKASQVLAQRVRLRQWPQVGHDRDVPPQGQLDTGPVLQRNQT